MSPFAKRLLFSGAAVVLIVILARSFLLSSTTHSREELRGKTDHGTAIDIRTSRRSVPSPARAPRSTSAKATSPLAPRTSGVIDLAQQPVATPPPVSGYLIDVFSGWTSIPAGYYAEGVALHAGALTLAGDATSTAPRTGLLQSPPLPLRMPAFTAPVQPATIIPDGAEIHLELSLSEDGQDWSPWFLAARYTPPDGHRVAAPMQPSLANADLHGPDLQTSTVLKGPAIKYRLTISASGVKSPSVSDLRIWKREMP